MPLGFDPSISVNHNHLANPFLSSLFGINSHSLAKPCTLDQLDADLIGYGAKVAVMTQKHISKRTIKVISGYSRDFASIAVIDLAIVLVALLIHWLHRRRVRMEISIHSSSCGSKFSF